MRKIATRAITSLLFTQVLCGCSIIGPSVLRDERIAYNEAIHDTSAQQLLINIVRARNFEDPTFSNLAEVDSQPSASGSISGGSANIGALVTLGSLSSTLGGSETSIQKHVSVTGAELIQQISSPITLKNVYRLINSNAPQIPLLRMSINRLGDSFIAADRIAELLYLLDVYGAIKPTKFDTQYTVNATFPSGSCPAPDFAKEITGGCIHYISGKDLGGLITFHDVITPGQGATSYFYYGTLTRDDG